MKKQLPLPAVIAAIVVAAGIGIFFLIQSGQSGPEFKPAPPTGKTPDYVLQQMSPEQQSKIKEAEAKAGITDDKLEAQKAAQPGGNPYGQK
ncbi:MAG: hypothetical protein JNM28_07995 [Armatimonadetes bacterium]|nr:hypothetical protein [Armatimonadota bacterium]MBS1712205.1 hypothetical protein [Armatimonadota bacterium]MBX3107912.1 hypothetical protein [Fimbriimonadaceae bacterium]